VRLKARVEAAGLQVWNIGNSNVHNMPEVTLNLPGRDQKIAEYKQYLRNLAQAGIRYTTMRTLHEVDFRGVAIADHVPGMVGGPRVGWAYSIGYMKALRAAVRVTGS